VAFVESIGIYEAKSRLSELVEKAEAGQEVVITRRGRPVVKLVRAKPEHAPGRAAVFKEIRAFAKTNRLRRKVSLRELRRMTAEGRD
jgi:prevent-host-death family protein